jgi:TadE-like protein
MNRAGETMSTSSIGGPKSRAPGQVLAELGLTLSLLLAVVIGTFQVGFLIFQEYVATTLAREGANLILRDSNLDVAESAIRAARGDADFDANTRLILSVVQLGAGGPNANKPIITARRVSGTLTGASVLGDPPAGSYSAGPDYSATDPAHDTSIQARTPLPNGLQIEAGQSVYVAEVYVKRRDIVPLDAAGVPANLYAVTYF